MSLSIIHAYTRMDGHCKGPVDYSLLSQNDGRPFRHIMTAICSHGACGLCVAQAQNPVRRVIDGIRCFLVTLSMAEGRAVPKGLYVTWCQISFHWTKFTVETWHKKCRGKRNTHPAFPPPRLRGLKKAKGGTAVIEYLSPAVRPRTETLPALWMKQSAESAFPGSFKIKPWLHSQKRAAQKAC